MFRKFRNQIMVLIIAADPGPRNVKVEQLINTLGEYDKYNSTRQ